MIRGPLRDTEREAAEDALALRKANERVPRDVTTIGGALASIRSEAQVSAITDRTRRTLDTNCEILLEAWFPETPVAEIRRFLDQ